VYCIIQRIQDDETNIHQVYCIIQRIQDDETKIHLSSLRLESVEIIWWEAKTQEDMKKHGKVLSSWNDFIHCN
jgi:hypothetical protein